MVLYFGTYNSAHWFRSIFPGSLRAHSSTRADDLHDRIGFGVGVKGLKMFKEEYWP